MSELGAGDSFEVAKRLLDEYGVVTAPGVGFGEAGEGVSVSATPTVQNG
ncbi:hypothetical protein [Halospeciosus flavus]